MIVSREEIMEGESMLGLGHEQFAEMCEISFIRQG